MRIQSSLSFLVILLSTSFSSAQEHFNYHNSAVQKNLPPQIEISLDAFLNNLNQDSINPQQVIAKDMDLHVSIFEEIQYLEKSLLDSLHITPSRRLMNAYSLGSDEYMLLINSSIHTDSPNPPQLHWRLIAKKVNNN